MSRFTFAIRLRAWLPLLPIMALLLGSYWLNLQVKPYESPTGALRHDIDFVVYGLRSTALDTEGQPRFALLTEKMWHYPDDDTTHMQSPNLISFFKDQPPTQIDALNGMLSSKGEEIRLYEKVRILRPGKPPSQAQHFNTEYLRVLPDDGWAETDFPILMYDRYNTINAVGMELNNEARTVKFLKQVRSVHENTD
ncbi:MAG: LPS export ABC transporter periplasmic protein LptC [Gammaproteobacteria bacterium]|nr:LPS export ABC transporter periplasmic protein LptC [Gammaproteobacteria bacterium]MBU1624866.1 LPS export ABC transporter periplasmic protein LptC [Gammaproteobacteria bacterium]MBU1982710.1 LPS export ABC transporter periplasmic protein LptC [Gammaproteobacteria bacterium]